jgi:predicted kinase
MATTHLISGLPCSGKTTYAAALRSGTAGVLFSLDRWLITSFGRYSIAEIGHPEHVRRVLSCRELIWSVATELLERGVDVILDDGFFFRENRMQFVARSLAAGAGARIHFLDVPLDVLRARLDRRNARLPRYNFAIDPATLEAFVGLYEAPSSGEGAELVVVRGGALEGPHLGDAS